MTIAKPEDLDRNLACRAYYNTSHLPEDRAIRDQQSYAEDVNSFHAEMLELAKTDDQKVVLVDEIERYRKGYLEKYEAYLRSHANVASAFIVGPARFPTARMEKRSRWADNKLSEFTDWRERARVAIKRKLLDLRPEEVKLAEHDARIWEDAEKSILARFAFLDRIDSGDSKGNNRKYFEDIIVYTVQKLAKAGNVSLTQRAIQLVKSYEDTHPLPAIPHNSRFWKLTDIAEKYAAKAQEKAAALANMVPETIAQTEGLKIISNPQADRVQIIFDAKPASDMIDKLKAEAWNWSRREGAWQRKLTEAAKVSAKRITGLV